MDASESKGIWHADFQLVGDPLYHLRYIYSHKLQLFFKWEVHTNSKFQFLYATIEGTISS